jgi:Fe-S cluster biogenesis protein NfuA
LLDPVDINVTDDAPTQPITIEVALPSTGSEAPDAGLDDSQIDLAALEETLEYIRPALQADGGDLVLLGTKGGRVALQLVGACGGCPMSTMTLTAGIERILKDRVPGVEEVVAI